MKTYTNIVVIIFLGYLLCNCSLVTKVPLSKVTQGKIERIANFESQYVTSRNVDVWLPDGYTNQKQYAVLYMHDGQMLYDSTTTWNGQAWEVDNMATQLMEANEVKDFIIVGIWNGGETRHPDYFPQQPFEQLNSSEKDTVSAQLQDANRAKTSFQPQSDRYLKFIVEELKPYIDRRFFTHKNAENTFIAGSSMGGLISMYAICEYPEIFGGAACLSTHWVGTFTLVNNPIPEAFVGYLSNHLPDPNTHKIYFDCGDQTLDAMYPAIQQQVDSVMIKKGYNEDNWMTKYFPGENHSERAWKKRLDIPLVFLLREN